MTRCNASITSWRCSRLKAPGSVWRTASTDMMSNVGRQVAPVVIDGLGQSLHERDPRAPARERAKAAVIGEVVTDVDALALWRKLTTLESAAARHAHQRLGQLGQAHRRATADV